MALSRYYIHGPNLCKFKDKNHKTMLRRLRCQRLVKDSTGKDPSMIRQRFMKAKDFAGMPKMLMLRHYRDLKLTFRTTLAYYSITLFLNIVAYF